MLDARLSQPGLALSELRDGGIPFHDVSIARKRRTFGPQAKSFASAARTASGITAMWP